MEITTRLFEFTDKKSSKFWEITLMDDCVIVRYGKTGTAGESQTLRFSDAAAAGKNAQNLVGEKLGKGYVEQCISAGTVNTSVASPTKDDVPETLVDSIAASGDMTLAARFLFGETARPPNVVAKFWKSPSVLIVEQLISRDANSYLQWALDLGFTGLLPDGSSLTDDRKLVDEWVESVLDKRSELCDQYIPKIGPVKTVQGELLYAMMNIDNTCRSTPDRWDDYLYELKSYVYDKVAVRNNFSHLVASAFVNDISELISSLPLLNKKQCASSIEFLQPTQYTVRLARMWVVVLKWIVSRPKPIKYSGTVEQVAGVKVNPLEPYKCKPLSRKMPKLDSYVEWAIDLGFDKEKLRGLGKRDAVHEAIDEWIMEVEGETNQLGRDLVPSQGEAATLQGELVRAHGRIANDLYRNGLMNWDLYYKGMLDRINSTLSNESSFSDRVKKGLAVDVAAMERAGQIGEAAAKGDRSRFDVLGGSFFAKTDAESALQRLGALIVIWVRKHPEAIPFVSYPE